ncbi:MAG: hypothetical protein ACLFV2_04575 [Desulfurivibrionaceae bacterium]
MAKKHIFDRQENIRRFLYIFLVLLAILLGLDFIIHRHSFFDWEKWPGFYPVFGFVACAIHALIAKYVLRPLVKRKEDYYDD